MVKAGPVLEEFFFRFYVISLESLIQHYYLYLQIIIIIKIIFRKEYQMKVTSEDMIELLLHLHKVGAVLQY
jgi:hypothetical protein